MERRILHSSERCIVERIHSHPQYPQCSTIVSKKYFKRSLRRQSMKSQMTPLQIVQREQQMIQLAHEQDNPGIIECLDVLETETSVELLMKDGGDPLLDMHQYPLQTVRHWLSTISQALISLHSRGLVHLDIKPSNLLLNDEGELRICDFGSAMIINSNGTIKQFPKITPAFASPELCLMTMGKGPLLDSIQGKPLDMWALGVTLFELLSGVMPFESEKDIITCYNSIVNDEPDYEDNELKFILQGLLEKSPTKRLTALQLYELLIA